MPKEDSLCGCCCGMFLGLILLIVVVLGPASLFDSIFYLFNGEPFFWKDIDPYFPLPGLIFGGIATALIVLMLLGLVIDDLKDHVIHIPSKKFGADFLTEMETKLGNDITTNSINIKFAKTAESSSIRSRHISNRVRHEVWRRDQGKCVTCGSRLNLEYDHIIPFSEGGSNTARNIELLCQECNRKKSNKI